MRHILSLGILICLAALLTSCKWPDGPDCDGDHHDRDSNEVELAVTPHPIDFGTITIEDASRTLKAQVWNLEEHDSLTLTSATFKQGLPIFAMTAPTLPVTLAPQGQPGDMAEITITCKPTASGTFVDTLYFNNDVTHGVPVRVVVQ